MAKHNLKRPVAPVLVVALLAIPILAACGTSSPQANSGPIVVGEFLPLTGKIAEFGKVFLQGAQTAVKYINDNGGVLGRQLTEVQADSGGDAVDAVPGMRKLLTQNPTFMVGSTSIEFSAVQPIIDSSKLPDFIRLPAAQYDNLSDPWVFRLTSGDTSQAAAMAFYALQKGYTKCGLILENTATAQTFQQPITHAYTSHGGTLLTTVVISPNQTSYRSEIIKAFANKPQCMFIANDLPSDNTFFANVRELGFINTPFIGSDYYTDPLEAKAFGPAASTSLTGITSSSGSGAAYTLFTGLYNAQWNATAPEYAISMFDGIMVAALAMTLAGSSDPKIWVNKVTAVTTDETATECSTYPDCVALIKQGKTLDYEGANGPLDFDAHHSVYSPISVVQFNSDLKTLHTLLTVPADTIKSYNS